MRRTASGRSFGFTLLELMVVVLIIGLIASFAVLSIGSRSLEDRLELEARRLNLLMELAADEAVQQGAEFGFLQTPGGYAFLVLDTDGNWIPFDEGGPLRLRELQPPFFLELSVEGRQVPPAEPGTEGVTPQVLLLSSGEATAFSLAVRASGHAPYYRLDGDALGRLSLERMDGPS